MTELLQDCLYPLLWVFAGLCVLLFYLRCRKRIRAFLLGGTTGILSLIVLHLHGMILGFTPTLCLSNLPIALFLGIPGTALIGIGEILR